MDKGHAKIVEALYRLVAFLQTLEASVYAPPNADISIPSLQNLHSQAVAELANVSEAKESWRTRAKDRALDIEKLAVIGASAVGLFAALGVEKERVRQARTYLRKLQGVRANKAGKKKAAKPVEIPVAELDPNAPPDTSEKSISAAQMSAAQKIANFRALVDFLTAQTDYALVKEAEVQPTDLNALADAIEAKHELSIVAAAEVKSRRTKRNKLFYENPDCICERGALVKEYVKGKFTASSPEYKTVRAISFERP